MVNFLHDAWYGSVAWVEAHPNTSRVLAGFVAGFLVRSVL
jgi:hypothetical protein